MVPLFGGGNGLGLRGLGQRGAYLLGAHQLGGMQVVAPIQETKSEPH